MSERPITIKLGGVAGQHAASLDRIAHRAPADTVLVHGGGSEIERWTRRLGLEPRTVGGLRITDAETLEVVTAVLGGLVNTRLVATLAAAGRRAVGLSGADDGLLRVRRRPDLGEVGEVLDVDPGVLRTVIASGALPVVATVAATHDGDLLNVNADEAAGAIAAARGGLLLLCTDVPGVLRDGTVLEQLTAEEATAMLADGSASAGMRPKLEAALVAARAGCEVRIVDGRSPDELERALDGAPAGTAVTAGSGAPA